MNTPLVSIICLCHNQAEYVAESIRSVLWQTYPNIELIVVDDASTDGSQEVIRQILNKIAQPVQFISLTQNLGNCKAFNQALWQSKGEYIIDLAADDVLLPHRVQTQVQGFLSLPADYGVLFSNAQLINSQGQFIRNYYSRLGNGRQVSNIPTGRVYQDLLRQAFICTPTMMMKRIVLEELNGYDESLSYEDYDFWVRSGRKWQYHYQDKILTQKRILTQSLGKKFYQKGENPHLDSTLKVCQKAFSQNNGNQVENSALTQSVRYHFRQAVWAENKELAKGFSELLFQLHDFSLADKLLQQLCEMNFPFHKLYGIYRRLRK